MLVDASLSSLTTQSITKAAPKSHIDTLNCTLKELTVLKAIEDKPKVTQTEIAKSIKNLHQPLNA